MADRRHTRALAPLLAGAWLVAALSPVALADVTTSTVPRVTGLAADPQRGGYWTAATDKPQLHLVGPDGSSSTTVGYDATPVDVQALALRDGRLWIGDIGDPQASRDSIEVYRIGQFSGDAVAPRRYSLRYPDGAHDAGAMTVSPRGRIYIVTRGEQPGIYRADAQPASGGAPNRLTRVGDAPEGVTDMVFSADGRRLVMRTGNGLLVLDPYTFTMVASAPLDKGANGEALTTALTGTGLVVADAATPTTLSDVELPTTLVDVPSAPASPTSGTPTPAVPTPSSAAAAVREATDTSNRGTLAALVAAGVLSLLAAAVVVVKR